MKEEMGKWRGGGVSWPKGWNGNTKGDGAKSDI